MDYSSKNPSTCFEDLSNEIIYEIFEFLDFYHIHQAFSKLNYRYYSFINHSNFPIKINISSMSLTSFQCYYKDIIISYQHRINSIHVTNPFIFNLQILSQFSQLKTLILENIHPEHLENLLYHLTSLPNLSSLIIKPAGSIQNQNSIYHQIFRLPVLKYCKVLFKEPVSTEPLHIVNNQYSPITHFVIDSNCHVNSLNALLSYLPQLRRLSFNNLSELSNQKINIQPLVLNKLTHLFFKIQNTSFDLIELFITNLSHQLQVFHFSTNYDITYLDANRWQGLILSHMVNLRIFNIELLPKYDSNQSVFHASINQFISSFWFRRQWFFKYEYKNSLATFYSIKPYRSKHYTLHNWHYQDAYPSKDDINLHSINHISIRDEIETTTNSIYFPNVTEVTLLDYSKENVPSISIMLDRILPLTKLYKLSVHCRDFYIGKLIELLYFSPNIHTLIINSISSPIQDSTLIQQTQTFRKIVNKNKIKNIILKENSPLQNIPFFIKLCPQLQQLTIDMSRIDELLFLQLNEMCNIDFGHLSFLCFLNTDGFLEKEIVPYLPNTYILKIISGNIYVWC